MSGGVDSSVTAALLKKRGYDVIGISLQLVPKDSELKSACCNINILSDAKRVAQKIGIPHYTINARDTFEKNVITPFINTYLKGETPNPCVECNRFIKFDLLDEKAKQLNADYIATGHYCQITHDRDKKRFFIKKAKDQSKDQSYFLYMLTQAQLKRTLFPLGNYEKAEIRAMANELDFINANRPDSQEICFVTDKRYTDFIDDQVSADQVPPGDIRLSNGQVLGTHTGIHRYTIGQRKGLNISYHAPLYVTDINPIKNEIIVGEKDDLESDTFELIAPHIVNKDRPVLNQTFTMKIRYRMNGFKAKVSAIHEDRLTITANKKLPFITPGQTGVLYQGEHVIGGGTIQRQSVNHNTH